MMSTIVGCCRVRRTNAVHCTLFWVFRERAGQGKGPSYRGFEPLRGEGCRDREFIVLLSTFASRQSYGYLESSSRLLARSGHCLRSCIDVSACRCQLCPLESSRWI